MLAFALQAVAAFNLVCTGTSRSGPFPGGDLSQPGGEPFTITYRVDLEQGRYCAGECITTEAIAEVTDTEITFHRVPITDRGGSRILVNRETGRYVHIEVVKDDATVYQGDCQRAPFTGFPQRRF